MIQKHVFFSAKWTPFHRIWPIQFILCSPKLASEGFRNPLSRTLSSAQEKLQRARKKKITSGQVQKRISLPERTEYVMYRMNYVRDLQHALEGLPVSNHLTRIDASKSTKGSFTTDTLYQVEKKL